MANKIKLLSERVANQIAAGEVVDRPASVVKELIENSLDAEAGRIEVEIGRGGKRSIRVIDDGQGMSRDDALLCLERHATSKVRSGDDLFRVSTLGFRGEAIPSIASVSRMTLVTREREADSGISVRVEGGTVKSVSETGAPAGTEMLVESLFFNVPARRKFLKSIETEFGHIATLVSNVALARPEVHLTLSHDGKTVFDMPASNSHYGRLRHALGADALRQLVEVDEAFGDGPRVHGHVSLPSYTRSSTRSLHLFVNGRFVRDRLINHAVFEAYRSLIPKGRYPLVVLFIDLPPEAVDVNVHPAKHEIRFRDQAGVHGAVVEAISSAIRSADRALAGAPVFRPAVGSGPGGHPGRGPWPAVHGSSCPPRETGGDHAADGVMDALRRFGERMERGEVQAGPGLFRREVSGTGRPTEEDNPPDVGEDTSPMATAGFSFSDARVIGQAAGSFIIVESEDSLIIIDQHAAHERIMFERLWRQYKEESIARQALLFPITVELSREEAGRIEDKRDALLELGFEVEPFGGGTLAVKAIPAVLAGSDPEKLLLEVVDKMGKSRGAEGLTDRLDEVFSLMACHSVVRANESLSMEEIKRLLAAMDEADFPRHCPHGRDAVVKIGFKELARWFQR